MDDIILVGVIVLVIALLMGSEYRNAKKARRLFLDRLYQSYGTFPEREYQAGEMDHIAMYCRRHTEAQQIDEITWNDLDMDRLYRQINTSCSAAGDEYLYYRLRTPVYDADEAERLESCVSFFMEHEAERHEVQDILAGLGRTGKHSVYEYLDNLDTLGERGNGRYLLWDLLLAASVGLMFCSLPFGMAAFLVILGHNIADYYKEYHQIEPYVTSFRYINRLLAVAKQMGRRRIPAIAGEQAGLAECYRDMKGFIRDSYLIVFTEKGNGNPLGIFADYLRMICYLDLIQFNRALRAVRAHIGQIDEMVTLLGRIEAAIAIGSYRNALDTWCIPQLHYDNDAERRLEIRKLYHPLLTAPVKNSVATDKSILITGSNASGKSTFLRAVAVNALLAQTIHTCPAERYEAPAFVICSSMSLRDDLLSGQSYYMVEIRSVKRILDRAVQAGVTGRPVLCFVDEVLRGTNTVERIAASTQIMKRLAGENAICLAGTHDVELTRLLKKEYDNYHFEERIEADDILFSYKLLEGPAATRNAIALLKALGYDGKIVSEAEKLARRFLEQGSWEEGTEG